MNCEYCKKPIGNAGTQDYCVLCSANLCDDCMGRTHCEESTTFAHKAWSSEEKTSLKEEIASRTDVRVGSRVMVQYAGDDLEGLPGRVIAIDDSDELTLTYSVRLIDSVPSSRYAPGDVVDLERRQIELRVEKGQEARA